MGDSGSFFSAVKWPEYRKTREWADAVSVSDTSSGSTLEAPGTRARPGDSRRYGRDQAGESGEIVDQLSDLTVEVDLDDLDRKSKDQGAGSLRVVPPLPLPLPLFPGT